MSNIVFGPRKDEFQGQIQKYEKFLDEAAHSESEAADLKARFAAMHVLKVIGGVVSTVEGEYVLPPDSKETIGDVNAHMGRLWGGMATFKLKQIGEPAQEKRLDTRHSLHVKAWLAETLKQRRGKEPPPGK